MSRKMLVVALIILLAALVVGSFTFHKYQSNNRAHETRRVPSAADLKARCEAINLMASADFAKHPIGSVTVGVVFRNELFWTKSYGSADIDKKLKADENTVYRIGSITKMFTALMLEQMVEAKEVHLSDPVERYFPAVKTVQGRFSDAPPITLIELATHTSGLDREPSDTSKYVQGPVSAWEQTLIAALPHTHYAFEPGTRFSYSNIGFAILGAALSRAAGQTYVEYIARHVFEPLGMKHTAFEVSPQIAPQLSKGYLAFEGKVDAELPQHENENGRGYKVPNGAIYTNTEDLARFCSFLLGQGPAAVLTTASLERNLMQSAVQADFQLAEGSVLGGMVTRRDGYTAFGHGGAVPGYQAALFMNRSANVGVIVLANSLGSDALDTKSLALKSLDTLSK